MDFLIVSLFWLTINNFDEVNSHARLIVPPSRSSAWRHGYPTPVNYNDNQLYCGGMNRQWFGNDGKCGICGDPWDARRDNEFPDGIYTKPLIIGGSYKSGSMIDTVVDVTVAHLGHFEFKLCPATSSRSEVTQECLDKHVLKVPRSSYEEFGRGFSDRFDFGDRRSGNYTVPVKLPEDMFCKRCVLQFKYTTGNTWGKCVNGSYAEGCGPQETFMGCADIEIYEDVKFHQFRPYHTLKLNYFE